MSVDREYRIRIVTVADPSGAQAVAGALDKTTDATHEATKAAEKHTVGLHQMHRLFHSLNEVVPGLGVVMQAAFSPIGATISLAVMALRLFQEHLRKVNEELDKMEAESAKPLTNRLEQQRETVVRTAEGMERLRERLVSAARAEEGLKDASERTIGSFKAQQAVAETLNDAIKENELADLEEQHAAGLISDEQYAEQRLVIEQKYLEKKRELAEREEMTEILIKKRLLEKAEMKQPELTAAAEAAEKAKEKALENLNSLDKEGVNERRKAAREALRKEEDRLGGKVVQGFENFGVGLSEAEFQQKSGEFVGRGGALPIGWGWSAYQKWENLRGNETRAKKSYEQLPGEEARLKVASDRASREADEAARRAEENQRYQTETGRDIGERRSRYDARAQSNRELSDIERDTLGKREDAATLSSPTGRALMDVARTEQMKAHGQRISAGQQSQEIAMTQLLNAFGLHGEVIVKGFGSMTSTVKSISDQVLALTRQMETFRAQHRDTFNQ